MSKTDDSGEYQLYTRRETLKGVGGAMVAVPLSHESGGDGGILDGIKDKLSTDDDFVVMHDGEVISENPKEFNFEGSAISEVTEVNDYDGLVRITLDADEGFWKENSQGELEPTSGQPIVTGDLRTDKINTEPGFVSGLLTEYVDSSTVAIHPGTCIGDDDETVITVETTLNCDISTTGAGGRQSGLSEQASSWYEIFIISEEEGENPAAFAVEESQSLALPSGYTVKRRVGWVRNNSSSNIYQFFQKGPDRVWWDKISNEHTPLDTTSPATSLTNVDISDHIPPSAEAAILKVFSKGDGTASAHVMSVRTPDGSVSDSYLTARGWAGHGAIDAQTVGETLVSDAGKVGYKTQASGRAIIRVVGYIDSR